MRNWCFRVVNLLSLLRRRSNIRLLAPAVCIGMLVHIASAGDLSHTPLFNGERSAIAGEGMLNNWGGHFSNGSIASISPETSVVRSGNGAYRVDLGAITDGGFGFFQTFSSNFGATTAHRQTRNLEYFDSLQGYIRNDTGTSFTLKVEFKDYRDSSGHLASRRYHIPASNNWTKINAPLNFGPGSGWSVQGSPDFERTFAMSYVVEATNGAVSGDLYLDDFDLIEAGGAIDIQTAPLKSLVERLAQRQFEGLWSARSRTHGLIPNTSYQSNLSALNTSAGVLWSLPAAVRRGWVGQTEADAYASQVAGTLNTILNTTSLVPARFVDLATANPATGWEESSVDAAFMALALHNYKSQPTTSAALRNTLHAVQNRFNLDAFANGNGFRFAFFPGQGFTGGIYDGYTNEGKVISVAAELSEDHHVPLEDLWNADVMRVRTSLVNANDAHLVHASDLFRTPFAQALLNLFVDTSERGVDNFGDRNLATNPWQNFVRYEREVGAKLKQLGRDGLFQPDAAEGGTPANYQAYSLYNDFGQSNLLMPWSVTFALLANVEGSEEALRSLLEADLHGPLGLADSARWDTNAASPFDVPAFQDNWNVSLSTLALFEILDRLDGVESSSSLFASLSELDAALDKVFVDGDLSGDEVTNAFDLSLWQTGFGNLAGATPSSGDTDGDGDVDGSDFLRWQRGYSGFSQPTSTARQVPEPATSLLVVTAVIIGLLSQRSHVVFIEKQGTAG